MSRAINVADHCFESRPSGLEWFGKGVFFISKNWRAISTTLFNNNEIELYVNIGHIRYELIINRNPLKHRPKPSPVIPPRPREGGDGEADTVGGGSTVGITLGNI